MKENRLGPRQWAFVVVAGGTLFSLPFVQQRPVAKPEPPVVDAVAALLPEADVENSPVAPATAASTALPNPPAWPTLPHSPFDELVQQKAVVPDVQPTEDVLPMQPLRPWISAPNLTNNSLASVPAQPTNPDRMTALNKGNARATEAVAHASPWRDDTADQVDVDGHQAPHPIATSFGQGRRQLPVTAGPADQYTYEEIAEKLNLPKVEDLASAIVPADQVLPVPPLQSAPREPAIVSKPSVVLSRQAASRQVGAQVRFGASAPLAGSSTPQSTEPPSMVPLPTLPPERRDHVIQQPKRM